MDQLPQHLCVRCAGLMQRCASFRRKCLRAHELLLPLTGLSRRKYRECRTCSVTFMSNDALKRHQETGAQKNHARLSPCVQCGDNFESEDALKQHADSEHPTCTECNSTFLNAESYNVHITRKHLGKGSSQQKERKAGYQRARVRVPPQMKNKCCELCGKMFNFHMRAHTGYKPYKCEHCDLAFSMFSNHQRHVMVVHKGVRNSAKCDICWHVLATPSTLRMHVRTVHNGEPWPKRAPRKKKNKNVEKPPK
ncbi:zinc finger protein 564-like isoform X2 [Leguminivora glycinivorella]|uniref:zinc finger protein 564-like isoform X2 n=1 Tax=Leguminivora glycinivorella TaxID=1035111 RepID=UPI00200C7D74|nr:zinc finger protein 564-like isoform X2 [Leguminivora glycinivorella]